jgi:hypothetical protein
MAEKPKANSTEEIEITPEMAAAGAEEIERLSFDLFCDSSMRVRSEMADAIFRRMISLSYRVSYRESG